MKQILILAVGFVLSCSNAQRVEPIDLTESNRELRRTEDNLYNYVVQLESALSKLEQAAANLETFDRQRLAPPFPADAFKHALISCLNVTTVLKDIGEPEYAQVAERFRITCPVPAIVALDRQLERDSAEFKFASSAMQDLDQFRMQRNISQKLLRDLPDHLERTTSFVGARTSDLRKTRDQTRRRKTEFRSADFAEAMDRLDLYEESLELLREKIQTIGDKREGWTSRLGEEIDALYKMLTELSADQETRRGNSTASAEL